MSSESKQSPKVKRATTKPKRGNQPGDKKLVRQKRKGTGVQCIKPGETLSGITDNRHVGATQRARQQRWQRDQSERIQRERQERIQRERQERILRNRQEIADFAVIHPEIVKLRDVAETVAKLMLEYYPKAPVGQKVDPKQWAYEQAVTVLSSEERSRSRALKYGRFCAITALEDSLELWTHSHNQQMAQVS